MHMECKTDTNAKRTEFKSQFTKALKDPCFFTQFLSVKKLLKAYNPKILNAKKMISEKIPTTPAGIIFTQDEINWPLLEYLVVIHGASFEYLTNYSQNSKFKTYQRNYKDRWQEERQIFLNQLKSPDRTALLLKNKQLEHENTPWLAEEYESQLSYIQKWRSPSAAPSQLFVRSNSKEAMQVLRQRKPHFKSEDNSTLTPRITR